MCCDGDDKVMCWGYNDGQLGDGTTTNRSSCGGFGFDTSTADYYGGMLRTKRAGNGTTSASQTDKVMCWGPNDWDLFGNETTATRLLHVELSGSTQAPLTTLLGINDINVPATKRAVRGR